MNNSFRKNSLEAKIASLIPSDWETVDVIALELSRDMEGWSVNTPWKICTGYTPQEALHSIRERWEVFKANYHSQAKVKDIIEDGDENTLYVDCDGIPFLEIRDATKDKAKPIFERVIKSLTRIDGETIDLPQELIDLCAAIEAQEETDWNLGEGDAFMLGDLIVGAYWALTEWHGGQSSPEYAALSSLSQIFYPGMSVGPEPESSEKEAYEAVCAYFEAKFKH